MNNRTAEQNFTLRSAKPKAEHKPVPQDKLDKGAIRRRIEDLTAPQFKEVWDSL